ncbi:MAG: HAD family hydrolase [Armatimonadetes bacterium]|nr:HAD family hydrolase [Armatimonadota bacterium]
MVEIQLPGAEALRLTHLLMDINGTLTVDGHLLPGVTQRVQALGALLTPVLVTADTMGTAEAVARTLGAELARLEPERGAEQKLRLIEQLGPEQTVAIGNGRNDELMLQAAALGIAVIQAEGAFWPTLQRADLVFASVTDALDALLTPARLVASLRP